MAEKNDILRKIIHILFGIIILISALIIPRDIFLRCLFILFLFVIFLTILHIKFRLKIIENISKENERRFPLKGLLFFIVGVGLVIFIFPKDIALASIAVLTFGDSVSSLAGFFGIKYRINPFRRYKSLFGTFCGIVIAFLFALIFVDPLQALVGSFFGMFSEAVSIKLGETDADDNLIVPLVAATAMYILLKISLGQFFNF
jgi:dolichol kinase